MRAQVRTPSPAAIEKAKLFWYDSLGCGLGGSQQEDAHILLAHYKEMGGSGPCTCFVSGFKTNPVDAAFLNDHMIRAMDYNDIYWKADPCHPSDIIAGPLALCELLNLSGKDLILATVIAYEVEMRLCEFGVPGIREYGWHHATLTAFAAPIAAGRVLNLTVDQMVQAIGISRGAHVLPRRGDGRQAHQHEEHRRSVGDAHGRRIGSARQARLLRPGAHDRRQGRPLRRLRPRRLQGHEGAIRDVACSSTICRSRRSDHYKIIDCGMKSFPIEALSHAPLTAMMKCVKENNIKPEQVAEIKVEVIARAADILGDPHKYRPDSKETADHSLPYSLAVGLVDGMVTPLQFKEERVHDPKLIPVMDKMKVVANDEFESLFPKFQPSQVTITTTDGKSFTKRVDVPKGDPRDPMTAEEIGVKFTALGKDVIGEAGVPRTRRHDHEDGNTAPASRN